MIVTDDSVCEKFNSISALIGCTPLLSIQYSWRGRPGRIFAKPEQFNLTGSIKDRIAFQILKEAYQRKVLRPGQPIIEATSGNTGISLSAIGARLGHPVMILMPDWMSHERRQLISGFGAHVVLISKEEGGFLASIRFAEEHAKKQEAFLPRQFANKANARAHALTTGMELVCQLDAIGAKPDAFVAGVGTGGTVMGVLECFRDLKIDAAVYPVEPLESPTLSTGYKVGSHRIQGISDEFVPPLVDLSALDRVLSVSDSDSIIAAQMLAAQLGLGVGISSGCNLLGALKIHEELGPSSIVTTVFPDDNKKYLSTSLFKPQLAAPDHLSNDLKLIDYELVSGFH